MDNLTSPDYSNKAIDSPGIEGVDMSIGDGVTKPGSKIPKEITALNPMEMNGNCSSECGLDNAAVNFIENGTIDLNQSRACSNFINMTNTTAISISHQEESISDRCSTSTTKEKMECIKFNKDEVKSYINVKGINFPQFLEDGNNLLRLPKIDRENLLKSVGCTNEENKGITYTVLI